MAEWLFEHGIGESRAALIEDGAIVEAAIEPEDHGVLAGTVTEGRLAEIIVPRRSGRVTLEDGTDVLLDGIPPGVSEGQNLLVRILREAIPEAGRPKLAKAIADNEAVRPEPGPALLARITASDFAVRILHAHEPDDLEAAGWSELLDEAENGEIAFPGGALRMAVTPAMTLFDVDGGLPAEPLALAASAAVARAILRLGIGGSIGIDFPTLPDKAARLAVADAFDSQFKLPFERTAVNGFGFMQVVRRRVRASLPEMLSADPARAALRAKLRQAERDPQPLDLSPASARTLNDHPDWLTELTRRTGRSVEHFTRI